MNKTLESKFSELIEKANYKGDLKLLDNLVKCVDMYNDTLRSINERDEEDIEWQVKKLNDEIEENEGYIDDDEETLLDTTDWETITCLKEEVANLIKENKEKAKEVDRLIARENEDLEDISETAYGKVWDAMEDLVGHSINGLENESSDNLNGFFFSTSTCFGTGKDSKLTLWFVDETQEQYSVA